MTSPDSRLDTGRAPDDPETWLDQHGNYLFRFALNRVRDASLAEDMVQETFMAALGSRDSFQGRSSVRSWLTSILKHKIVDQFRKTVREQPNEEVETISDRLDTLFDDRGHWKVKPNDWTVDPVKIYEQKEFMDVLYHCLAQLPERLARIFMLREIDGMDTEEICKELDITATNTGVMLYRARMGLRECIGIKWVGQPAPE